MYKNGVDRTKLPGDYKLGLGIGHNIPDYFPEDYVVLDLETTGLNPERDEIIEICAVRYSDNVKVATYSTLVQPSEALSYDITQITGITNEMLEEAEDRTRALSELKHFVGDSILVGYCVDFDIKFLFGKFKEIFDISFSNWYVDVHDLAKKYVPKLEHYRQVDVCKALSVSSKGAHRAGNDCKMCNDIFQKIKEIAIAGYKTPIARQLLEVTEYGRKAHPFSAKHFYLLGTFAEATKYNIANLLIGLGALIDDRFTDITSYIIVGMTEASALESTEMRIIAGKKKAGSNIYILKEKIFLEALKNKNYINSQQDKLSIRRNI